MKRATPTSEPTVWELYSSEEEKLLRLAVLLVGSRADAEDVVYDCLARFATSVDRAAVRNQTAYLRKMVVNACYAVGRRRSRERHGWDLPAASYTDDSLLEFADAVRRLSPRRRQAVVLRYACDLPVREIAELMNCRPATVSSLLNRAMKNLEGSL